MGPESSNLLLNPLNLDYTIRMPQPPPSRARILINAIEFEIIIQMNGM